VCQPDGEVIITNDGATILNKMSVIQPAAKMLVELAKAQVVTSILCPLCTRCLLKFRLALGLSWLAAVLTHAPARVLG
jgi:hypothetical protein